MSAFWLSADQQWVRPAPPSPIIEVDLDVAVRQKEDGKLGNEIYLFTLSCGGGQCTLDAILLNACLPHMDTQNIKDVRGFTPLVKRTSTADGTLKVTLVHAAPLGRTLIGDRTLTGALKIESTPGGDPSMTKETLLWGYAVEDGASISAMTTSFSGGYVQYVPGLMKKVATVEYVPLLGIHQLVALDCGVWLPGVPTKEELSLRLKAR